MWNIYLSSGRHRLQLNVVVLVVHRRSNKTRYLNISIYSYFIFFIIISLHRIYLLRKLFYKILFIMNSFFYTWWALISIIDSVLLIPLNVLFISCEFFVYSKMYLFKGYSLIWWVLKLQYLKYNIKNGEGKTYVWTWKSFQWKRWQISTVVNSCSTCFVFYERNTLKAIRFIHQC